jgi:zinc protease
MMSGNRVLCLVCLLANLVSAGTGQALAAENPAPNVSLPEFSRFVLDNGAVIMLAEKPDVPLVGLELVIRSGAVSDPDGFAGVASLLADLMEKGAGDRDAAAFAEAVDSVGGSLRATAGLEAISISAEFLSRDAALMIELVSDMVMRPQLLPNEFEKLRSRSIEFIKSAKDSRPQSLIATYGAAALFVDHAYGRPVGGSESSLADIGLEVLKDYYAAELGADRLVIAVSGDFDLGRMRRDLQKAFGGWRKAKNRVTEVDAYPRQQGRRVLLVDKPGATQTYFWIGNTGVSISYDKRAELNLANTVYGGRFTSMLNTELRINSGLTYGASSRLRRPSTPGSQAIVSFTKTESTVEAVDLALRVSAKFRDAGLDNDALRSAKNYVLGQFPTRLETATQLAAQLSKLEFYGLDASYINNYGANIQAADDAGIDAVIADVYPSQEDLVFVFIGDAERIREQITKYGKVTEMSITAKAFHP